LGREKRGDIARRSRNLPDRERSLARSVSQDNKALVDPNAHLVIHALRTGTVRDKLRRMQ